MTASALRHALTIDVEDWYHVENLHERFPPESWAAQDARIEIGLDRVLSLLAEFDCRATFFVLGAAAERHPECVRRIHAAGHEIGSHGWSHDLIYRQEPELFRAETRRGKAYLEDMIGEPVRGYRASTFSITDRSLWALDILAEEGFVYDSSVAPVRHGRYGIPSAPHHPHCRDLGQGRRIVEFPVSFGQLVGKRLPLGGGFFRLLPLAWTARGLRRYEREGQSAMIYLHPWEFDPAQPRVSGLGFSRRFRHYTGLATTELKLRGLLESFRFGTMGDILEPVIAAAGVEAPA